MPRSQDSQPPRLPAISYSRAPRSTSPIKVLSCCGACGHGNLNWEKAPSIIIVVLRLSLQVRQLPFLSENPIIILASSSNLLLNVIIRDTRAEPLSAECARG